MATKKWGLELEGLDGLLDRIKKLEGDAKTVAEAALTETHRIVTAKAEAAMAPANLPAKGKYSTGGTLRSLRRDAVIEWNGTVASVPVGFDIEHGGLASIFLMHGTPRMKPDRQLYDAFYGKQTQAEVVEAQEAAFYAAIRNLEGV